MGVTFWDNFASISLAGYVLSGCSRILMMMIKVWS